MKTVLLATLTAIVIGVGSAGLAFAEGGEGAGEDAQGTRPDVLGTRLYGAWPGAYGSYYRSSAFSPFGVVVVHGHHHHHKSFH